jgi:hypothetical protein
MGVLNIIILTSGKDIGSLFCQNNKMKKAISLALGLIFFALSGNAQADDEGKEYQTVFKAYPLRMFLSQMPYTSDIHFAFEHKVRKHQSFQIGFGFSYPRPLGAIIQIINTPTSPYWLVGGHGDISYRYYFTEAKREEPFGWYFGVEVAINGLVSQKRTESLGESFHGYYYPTVESRSHFIMSNYNFTIGYHFVTHKFSLDIGGSIGYRYHYFWRHYDKGNLEYSKYGQPYNLDLYLYYKKSPLGGSINFSLGRLF